LPEQTARQLRISENMVEWSGGRRWLAAILAADVAGYSRHLFEDEAGTPARLAGILDAACKGVPITAPGWQYV